MCSRVSEYRLEVGAKRDNPRAIPFRGPGAFAVLQNDIELLMALAD